MDLAGPVIQGEAMLEKAFERLTEAATEELVAKPVTASVDHRLWWRSGVADVSAGSGRDGAHLMNWSSCAPR